MPRKSPSLYYSLALISLTCQSPNFQWEKEARQTENSWKMASEDWWASMCRYFRASANFLTLLDRAEKRKMVASSSFPVAIWFLTFPSTTTTRGKEQVVGERGEKKGDLNSNKNYNSVYGVFSVYRTVLRITHTLTDLMSSKLIFQQKLGTNPSRRNWKMSKIKTEKTHPSMCIKSDPCWKSSRASSTMEPTLMPSASS